MSYTKTYYINFKEGKSNKTIVTVSKIANIETVISNLYFNIQTEYYVNFNIIAIIGLVMSLCILFVEKPV